jgi:hypothetical protein
LDESQHAIAEARRATAEAHRQADAVEKQTRISVRPWVGLTDQGNPIPTTHVGINKDGDANVTYAIISKNYGNSAATGVGAYAQRSRENQKMEVLVSAVVILMCYVKNVFYVTEIWS